uniref:Uncharacterized protein n=1 Tax=Leersia perrieri TaxID=77586 RepID=A0A0D9VUJ5_9ORYZ
MILVVEVCSAILRKVEGVKQSYPQTVIFFFSFLRSQQHPPPAGAPPPHGAMAISPPPPSPSSGDPTEAARLAAAAALALPARIWSSILSRLPSLPDRGSFGGGRRRRRPALPLPIRTAAAHSVGVSAEMPKAFGILEDIVQHTLSSLHDIQKSLLFWQSKAEGTNSQKMYFMIFERGPRAFAEATLQTLTRVRSNEGPIQYLLHSASDMVSTKLAILTSMQHCLAAFLAEVYCEVDKFREGLTENSDKSIHTLFVVLNTVFSKLEVKLQNVCEGQALLFTHDGSSSELLFERLPEIDDESSEWTEISSIDAISLVYQNLQKLDNFVSSQISSHRKPRHMTVYWLPYTCGALGLSACSLWLLRHSSFMGSSDIDNWIQGAKESIAGFWDVHVEKPVISIRGELFETFKNRGKHVMDKQEVQLNEEVLHRMMLAFCQQTSNEELPQDISEQALMEIFMDRYEKEWTHPVKNLFRGELAYAMLIQLQKRTVDIKQALLELDQILKGNAINFAILAALPAFGVSLLLLTVVQAWVMNDQGAEGRGRIARRQRRLLLLDAERRLMEFKNCMANGMEEEACCKFGLTLYTLDRLYRAVESHAEETGEWSRLREDILDLSKPTVSVRDKQVVLSRLKGTIAGEMPKAFDILQDVMQHTLSNLHNVQKSLLYWESKVEGTNSQKLYFMIFERGPRAFVEAAWQTLTSLKSNGSPVPHLLHSASDMVSTKVAALTSMQHCLAAFLAEVYFEVDKCREGLTESSDKSLHTLFIVLNSVFSKLEVSFKKAGEGQTLLFTHDGNSPELIIERLPEVDVESSEWTEVLSTDAITLIYQNLQKLDVFISDQFSSHKKPSNMTIYWLPYTCGALGLSACSLWLLRHSSLMGSSDIDNWIQDAKESMVGFWDVHVGQPIISIRDELFETFKQRSKREMEKQEVQQTEESLRRMLLDFCGNTSNEKQSQDISELAMMEIVMKRYEKEAMHPFQGLSSGQLTRALSIQIEKHKLALLEAMLELDQILRANEINFAILAALPAFGFSLLLLFAVRAWATHEEEACCKFGLILYTLDRLYKAVESHARETGEWSSLREDMFDLAKIDMDIGDKLVLLSRLKGMYDCLLPSPSVLGR